MNDLRLVDSHCHLNLPEVEADLAALMQRAGDAGVQAIVVPGIDLASSRRAVELAEHWPGVYAAVGVHPHHAASWSGQTRAELRALARAPRVVAIGETGLDFHYNFSKQPDQKRVFEGHLEIAKEMNSPVIVHSRNAFAETMEILDRSGGGLRGVVFHCFSGSAEEAGLVLERGYYVSFTGVVTFKNAEKTREAAKVVPLERLMVETDCPYLSPEPVRSQKPNEPALMVHTARLLSQVKGVNLEDFAQATTQNAAAFFNLPDATRA